MTDTEKSVYLKPTVMKKIEKSVYLKPTAMKKIEKSVYLKPTAMKKNIILVPRHTVGIKCIWFEEVSVN